MKSQWWCNECGYVFLLDASDEKLCPNCRSKDIIFEFNVGKARDKVFISKKAHEVNRYV